MQFFKQIFSVFEYDRIVFTSPKGNTAKGFLGIIVFAVKKAMDIFDAAELKKK